MYSLNLSTLKNYIILVFSSYTRIWDVNERVHKKSNYYTQVQVFFLFIFFYAGLQVALRRPRAYAGRLARAASLCGPRAYAGRAVMGL